jgi:hypothetical protein
MKKSTIITVMALSFFLSSISQATCIYVYRELQPMSMWANIGGGAILGGGIAAGIGTKESDHEPGTGRMKTVLISAGVGAATMAVITAVKNGRHGDYKNMDKVLEDARRGEGKNLNKFYNEVQKLDAADKVKPTLSEVQALLVQSDIAHEEDGLGAFCRNGALKRSEAVSWVFGAISRSR